jgi:hypothetical protein
MSIIDIERPQAAPVRERISLVDVTSVELRKMFDTRAGFWLTASIGITALLATTATILFAPDDELKYSTFATAIGFPMAVILPMIAILSVTSEWSQRSGLTTFTWCPTDSASSSARRSRQWASASSRCCSRSSSVRWALSSAPR